MAKDKRTQEEQSEFSWEGDSKKTTGESEFNWEGASSGNSDEQKKESNKKEESKSKKLDKVEKEATNTNSNLNITNNQPAVNNGQLNGMKVFAFVILMIGIVFVFILVFFNSDPFGDRVGDAEYAKDKAIEYFEGPNTTSSQLQCEPKELVGDLILVKCETTDEDVINYYGSSTLWYGMLFKADGLNYSYYGNSNREEVINHFNK